jgi:hypothetical protein
MSSYIMKEGGVNTDFVNVVYACVCVTGYEIMYDRSESLLFVIGMHHNCTKST